MGGSGQWGNRVPGVGLGRRMGTHHLYALTTPLLTTASGAKMGKAGAGGVWLKDDQFSPYDYWQYWRNTEDADVERFLKLFTTLSKDEIARLATLRGQEINEAKKVLATAATTLLHGPTAAKKAAITAQKTFEEGVVSQTLPTFEVPRQELESGYGILTPNIALGSVTSNRQAPRPIKRSGLPLNALPLTH